MELILLQLISLFGFGKQLGSFKDEMSVNGVFWVCACVRPLCV